MTWHQEHLPHGSRAAYWLGVFAQCANDERVTAYIIDMHPCTHLALWRREFIAWDDDTATCHVTEAGHREAMREHDR